MGLGHQGSLQGELNSRFFKKKKKIIIRHKSPNKLGFNADMLVTLQKSQYCIIVLYLDLNSAVFFVFVFFLAEVHRPLHGCDDPALCHHTTP